MAQAERAQDVGDDLALSDAAPDGQDDHLDEQSLAELSGVRPRPTLVPPTQPAPDLGSVADVFGITHPGCVRPSNQDQFLVAELERSLTVQASSGNRDALGMPRSSQARLMVVADGMGGYEGGEVASAVAVETFTAYLLALSPWLVSSSPALREEFANGLRAAVTSADLAVHRVSQQLSLDERMGSTLTALYVTWPEAYVVHVGDSRCYLLRNGALARLTTDHTVAQELVDQHSMSPEEALGSHLRHVLFNAVGGLRGKRLLTDVTLLELRRGDSILLCTDGLIAHVEEDELAGFLAGPGPAEVIARELVDTVRERGGFDNVTVVVARF